MSTRYEDVYRLALQLPSEERRRLAADLADSPSSLTAEAILSAINAHAEPLRRRGVRRIGLFGSYVRGEARLNSDIDLLVTLDRPPSVRGFMGLKRYLEDVLGCPVDLVLADSLREELRPAVLEEVVYAEGL